MLKGFLVACIMVALLWIVVASPASAYDCRSQDPRVTGAIKRATDRASGGSASMAHCANYNIQSVMIWKVLQCLDNDPTLAPKHRQALLQSLPTYRKHARQSLRAVGQLGGTCSCWSNICAD